MLSIHWIQDVDYYLDQATADYYFRPGEPPGRWWGRGARSLGLTGTVTAQQLKALCKGFSPDGRVLIQNAGAKDHQQAWDLTFSAPKSVSVLWTQAPRAVRFKIRKFHHKAVKAALDYLAGTALLTRRGKGGKVREHALPVVAVFEHGSNRELEPQLHSHCVLVNAAGRADGTFGTILSDPFYRHKLTAGAIYRAQLAYLLRNGLGLEIERQEKAFAVRGVPKKLVDHYSTRRRQIETKLGSKGSHSSKAAATAALDTRKTKRKSPPPRGELFQRWQATNSKFGFSEAMAERLLGRVAPDNKVPVLDDHITRVIAELLETESFFSEQQLIRGVAIDVVADGVQATDVIDQVREYLAVDPEILTLGPHHDETVFTTREMWALEKELFAAIAQGEADSAHVVGTHVVGRILDRELPLGPTLTDDKSRRNKEQRSAVIGLVTTPGDVHVMEGMAGTGKTFTLKVARQAWEKAGYRVTGVALSAVAAANLQEGSGIPSDTIAMRLLQLDGRRDFARHHKRQLKRLLTGKRTYAYDGRRFRLDRKTIVVVDEAGMVGTRQMVKLLKHVRKAGAKLVLVGDRRQLQPVEAGGAFAPIARATKRADLQHVVRQAVEPDDPNPSWHREAGKLIAAGAVSKAIKLFAERGRLSVLWERDQTMLSIVRDWSVQGITDPSNHIVLAATRAEVSELNAMCQSARLQAGALGAEHCITGEVKLHTGDIVLFTKNSRLYQVKNGDRGQVLGFNRLNKTMAVRLHQSNKTVYLPYRNYKDVQLGYSMTTHKAQGATVPSVYVLLGGPMQDRHLSYVQATRACESTRLYVDKSHAGPDLKHLLKHMERPRPKKLAHDIASSSGPDGGLPPNTSAPTSASRSSNSQKSRRAKKRPKSSATSADSAGAGKAAATPSVHQEPAGVRDQHLTKGRDAQVPTDGDRNTPSISSPAAKPPVQLTDRANSPAPRSPKTVGRPPVAADQPKASDSDGGQTHAAPVHGSDTQHDSPQPAPPESRNPKTVAAKPPSRVIPTRTPVRSQTPVADLLIPALRPRDILDLTHVNVVTTTDADFLRAAVKRYGAVPGGVVVEGSAQCLVQIRSLGIDPRQPSSLLINGFKTFDTGLSADEVALIWHAVLEAGQATTDFGALSQRKTIGIDNDTEVGVTMLKADNALGAVAYGYDSQYNLGRRPGPDHRNPFVEETEQSLLKVGTERLFFNYMNEILPQLFLTVSDTRFAETRPGLVSVTSTKVTAALAITTWGGALVTNQLLPVTKYFPLIHQAVQAMARHFGEHARAEPCIARTIAFAELVSLLRAAKAAKATLSSSDHVRSLVARRQRQPLPQYNYTLRSKDFATLAADTARRLSRTESTSFDGLMATTVGLRYAAQAGDFTTFSTCKRHALKCIARLQTQTFENEYRVLSQALPHLEERIRESCHDTLIDACIEAACDPGCPSEDRVAYLNKAMRLCGPADVMTQNSPTRCRWLEARSYLHSNFDPVPELAKVRAADPSTTLPFSVLTMVKARRRGEGDIFERGRQLDTADLTGPYADLWLKLRDRHSHRAVLSLCKELQRFDLRIQDYLTTFANHSTDAPNRVLSRLLVARLAHLPATSFSTRFLHRDNPFVASHELLDYETPANLTKLFSPVRRDVERFDFLIPREKTGLRKLFSTFLPHDLPDWWAQFLKAHASSSGSEASKTALLLAHELKSRGRTVKDLYDQMRQHRTKNPQAGLFLLDLEKTA